MISLIRRVVHGRFIKAKATVFSSLYRPRHLLVDGDADGVDMLNAAIDNINYYVADVRPAILFTDRNSNITLSHKKFLVPNVSWQYHNGHILPDNENYLLRGTLPISVPPAPQRAPIVSLLTGGGGNYNYYHWLFDSLPRLEICQCAIGSLSQFHFVVPDDTLAFQQDTLRMLGIDPSRVISSRLMPHLSSPRIICTSHPNPDASNIPAWIGRFLRGRLAPHATRKSFAPFVYVSRGDSVNERRLQNENALINQLESRGFRSYTLSELTVAQQINLFQNAKIVIGVHGAGFAN